MKSFIGSITIAAILICGGIPAGAEERTVQVRASVMSAVTVSTSASVPGGSASQPVRFGLAEGVHAALACRTNESMTRRGVIIQYAARSDIMLTKRDAVDHTVRKTSVCGMRIFWNGPEEQGAAREGTGLLTIEP